VLQYSYHTRKGGDCLSPSEVGKVRKGKCYNDRQCQKKKGEARESQAVVSVYKRKKKNPQRITSSKGKRQIDGGGFVLATGEIKTHQMPGGNQRCRPKPSGRQRGTIECKGTPASWTPCLFQRTAEVKNRVQGKKSSPGDVRIKEGLRLPQIGIIAATGTSATTILFCWNAERTDLASSQTSVGEGDLASGRLGRDCSEKTGDWGKNGHNRGHPGGGELSKETDYIHLL